MASSFHFAVANLVLFFAIASSKEYVDPWGHYCSSNVSSGSPVLANRNDVLDAMTRAFQPNIGFSALSSGVGPNTVYGLANCRGDLNIREYCMPCIRDAVEQIRSRCPYGSDFQIWYDYCIVRYSRRNFFGTFDPTREVIHRSSANYPDPDSLFNRLPSLFNTIINGVVSPDNNGMVRKQTGLPRGFTLYGGALCTGDLRPAVCIQCLRAAVLRFHSFCKPRWGCRVFLSSCFARYSIDPITPSLDAGFNNTLPGQATETSLTRYEFEQAEQVNNTLTSGKSMMISSF